MKTFLRICSRLSWNRGFLGFWMALLLSTALSAGPEIYSKVEIGVQSPADIARLQQQDITVEHFRFNPQRGIELVLNQEELARLDAAGLSYTVLTADLAAAYRDRRPSTAAELEAGRRIMAGDNIEGFDLGSMGGFYTYDEITAVLDTMYAHYPSIITQKVAIGASVQDRSIWMVKISDNPTVNESATEGVVYYDALHHAREPAGMAVTIYYMFWLLENYGIDPHATYLVDNREMYFVPVVNPDGYVYNQQTNPNGGGYWRKNRRNNAGSCYGVDLNRNYSYGYNTGGSSNDPCSETYHGTGPFSEPETQSVRDLILTIHPAIGFSTHSVAGTYLNPYGYTSISPEYDIYSEFASDFATANGYLYGRTSEMLGYTSSGTTRDYLHSEGTYAWTPEIGGSDFWPFISEIMPLVSENLYPMQYLSWVSGEFADFQNYQILGSGYAEAGDTLDLMITVKNRGLSLPANNVLVEVSTDYPHALPVVESVSYDTISARELKDNSLNPFRFALDNSAAFLDEIPFYISISQDGVVTVRDTIHCTVARATVIFQDNSEDGTFSWTASGTAAMWDTTFVDYYNGAHSFADSRYGSSPNNASAYFRLNQTINLTEALHPRLEFWAKWAIEDGYDYARLQISTNNGSTWTTLAGSYTHIVAGQPSYSAIQHWVKESIDLSAYSGSNVQFRFFFDSDGGLNGDGFYFDEFKVVDYSQTPVGIGGDQPLAPQRLELYQNYPNPFNPVTTIAYQLPLRYQGEKVRLQIFNSLGQRVRTLVNGVQNPGTHEVRWDGTNDAGLALSSGIYLYKLTAGDMSLTRKMLLIK